MNVSKRNELFADAPDHRKRVMIAQDIIRQMDSAAAAASAAYAADAARDKVLALGCKLLCLAHGRPDLVVEWEEDMEL